MTARRQGESGGHQRLPGAVYWFGATSFLNDSASEIIYPLLPAFVTRVLGGNAIVLGALEGAAESVAAAFKLGGGYLAERARLRGPLVTGGYALAAIVRPLLAMASASWQVIALRVADRAGKGLRTAPRDVMIADATPQPMRGRAFGLHRASDHAGAIAGPLIAAALLSIGLSLRDVFWVAAVPGALSVACAAIAVRHGRRAAGGAAGSGTAPEPETAAAVSSRRRAMTPALFALALATTLRVPETLLILRVQDLGLAVAAVPLLWAALHALRSAVAYPGGALADRFGERPVLAAGWVAYAALAVLLGTSSSVTGGSVLFIALGAATAFTEAPERALVARLAGAAARGRGFGWYHGLTSAVALPGALLAGWLYQAHGAAAAFATAAAVAVLAAVSLTAARSTA